MNSKIIFLFYIVISILFNFCSKVILNNDELLFNSLAEQLSTEQFQESLDFRQKWQWIVYLITPVFLLIKTSIIAVILDFGCFFFNKEIKYKTLFNIAVKAEFVFLLVIIFKTIWFYAFQQNYTLEDLNYFYPLSAINITGYNNLQPWFVYPLQTLNLFELAYWVILAYLLGIELKTNTDNGLLIVASSYGVSLLIWVVAIMFFTLNMN